MHTVESCFSIRLWFQSLYFIQHDLSCIRRHLCDFYQAQSGFWQGKKRCLCVNLDLFASYMIWLYWNHCADYQLLKKKKLYMLTDTYIKLRVYVWVDSCYQFKIVSIDMIEDLCMIGHAFKSIHVF